MRFQLVVDFDAESPLEAELVASLVMGYFRQYAQAVGDVELVERLGCVVAE